MKKAMVVSVTIGVLMLSACVGPVVPIGDMILAAFTWIVSNTNSRAVSFDASASASDFGDILFYSWDFGDGVTQILAVSDVTHVYADWGDFNVVLTVTAGDGSTDEAKHEIALSPTLPVAKFGKTDEVAVGGGTRVRVTFDARESRSVDGDIVSAKWWFGDGDGVEGAWPDEVAGIIPEDPMAVVSHTYDENGQYTVTLEITDSNGLTHTRTRKIGVTRP